MPTCCCCSKSRSKVSLPSDRPNNNNGKRQMSRVVGEKPSGILKELNCDTYAEYTEVRSPFKKYDLCDFFFIGNILGAGENSVVFQATFLPTNQKVAIKYISDYTRARKGIQRELQVLQISKHCPHLLHYHSHFRIKGKCYIVTEQLTPINFNQFLSPNLRLPPVLVLIYAKQLSKAIMFLHDRKIIHRDVTLKNLGLDQVGNLRLIDYNLSRTVKDAMGTTFSNLGSCQYAAPEIYKDHLCSYPVDWWSVGVCIYRFVTGGFPYPTNARSHYSYYVLKTHRVVYPKEFFSDVNLQSMTQKLLRTNQASRLGTKCDVDIKSEPFFRNVQWNAPDDVPAAILATELRDLVWFKEVYRNMMSVLFETLSSQSTSSRMVERWNMLESIIYDSKENKPYARPSTHEAMVAKKKWLTENSSEV